MIPKIIILLWSLVHLVKGSTIGQTRNDEIVHCYNDVESPSVPQYRQFSTKTAYSVAKGTLREDKVEGIALLDRTIYRR